jgi:hypothetical protein
LPAEIIRSNIPIIVDTGVGISAGLAAESSRSRELTTTGRIDE